MQRKIVIDTCVYIDIFKGRYQVHLDFLNNVTYLAYPVFHELMMESKSHSESNALLEWADTFASVKRVILPSETTLFRIGQLCRKMGSKGKLDPVYPKHYNDICIAMPARQIGATVLTTDKEGFKEIQNVVDVQCDYSLH